jgi:hypothetical protein
MEGRSINIHLNLKDDLFYLSKKGSVATQCGHLRHSVIFARADHIETNAENMLKDFEVANVKPSTASSLLHHIDDRVYHPKAIFNIIAKAQKAWLSNRGINTKTASAQVLVDYLSVSLNNSCVFLLHEPDSTLTGSTKKVKPKKSSPMRGVVKDFNIQVIQF